MNLIDVLVGTGALAIVVGILAYRIYRRKKGNPVGCSCSSCQGCSGGCPSSSDEKI